MKDFYKAVSRFSRKLKLEKKRSPLETLREAFERSSGMTLGDHHSVTSGLSDLTFLAHTQEGAQIWVSNEVSSDLIHSNVPAPDFANLVWPHSSLEFVFEDERIPSFLMRNEKMGSISEWLAKLSTRVTGVEVPPHLRGHKSNCIYLYAMENPDDNAGNNIVLGFMVEPEIMNELALSALSGKKEQLRESKNWNDEVGEGRKADMAHLALLAFKVLMFSSIPKFKAQKVSPTPEKPKKASSGKIIYPPRVEPHYVVRYLPRHIAEKKEQAEKLGSSRTFRGRLGCLRTYRSSRYVNKQGEEVWMYPIPDPLGADVKHKFIVRSS